MKNRDDVFVMYLVVRESLSMSPGKLCAQVGHAVMQLVDVYYKTLRGEGDNKFERICERNNTDYFDWRFEPTKVVLRANEEQWQELKKLPCTVVIDGGYTEVPPNSETVLGFWPMKKSDAPELIKSLKLL